MSRRAGGRLFAVQAARGPELGLFFAAPVRGGSERSRRSVRSWMTRFAEGHGVFRVEAFDHLFAVGPDVEDLERIRTG